MSDFTYPARDESLVLMHGLHRQALGIKQMILETDEVVFVYTVASHGIISAVFGCLNAVCELYFIKLDIN